MFDETARKAISAALNKDWENAVKFNLLILEETPEDIRALNRLAQAYMQVNELEKSKESALKILTFDPLNTLAEKCLNKIKFMSENGLEIEQQRKIAPSHFFIEEPGKTKLTSLINICEQTALAMLTEGEYVTMQHRYPKVVITSTTDVYIGRLPDDLAHKIISLTEDGKKFEAYIKSIGNDYVKIFIRETHSPNSSFISFPAR